MTGAVGEYLITQWLFDTARGQYEIDLAESCMPVRSFAELMPDSDVFLDYCLDRGSGEIRRAVADLYGGGCSPDDVVMSHGGQESLYLFYRTFLSPGDHVIAAVPGWQQSWELPQAIGCDVSRISCKPGDPFDVDALRSSIRKDTSLVILCSPGNPSGRLISNREWAEIIAVLDRAGTWLISDEEFMTDLSGSMIHQYPRCVSVSSLSKMDGLPGLRIGWAATSSADGRAVLEKMVNYKRYVTISNSSVCERIALNVLTDLTAHRARHLASARDGLRALSKFADKHRDSIYLVPPQGTPFAWFDLNSSITSWDLAKRLLMEHRVLIMPAEVFGWSAGFRLTYARPADALAVGLRRLGNLLEDLGR